jgi:hypothetical protein
MIRLDHYTIIAHNDSFSSMIKLNLKKTTIPISSAQPK